MDQAQQIVEWASTASLAAGLGLLAWRIWFVATAQNATGEVVRHAEHQGYADVGGEQQPFTPLYASVIAFRDQLGRRVQFESGVRANPAQHILGQSVRVLYDPANASNASVYSLGELWGLPLLLIVLGSYGIWGNITAFFG